MKRRNFAIILAVTVVLLLSTSTSSPEIDQTGNIKILAHGLTYNKSDGTTSCYYHLQNNSKHTLSGPFSVVIEAMNNSDVSIINPDEYTAEGKPYFLYTENQLAPGKNTTDKLWVFDHQCGKKAAVTLSKYSSSVKLVFKKKCTAALTVYYSIVSPEQGANHPPVANAGPDQVVHVGAVVELDGSRSTDIDGDLLSYKWSIISKPAGAKVTLSDSTSVRPSFTAVKPGNYAVQLIVNDGVADSTPDRCIISTKGLPPVANAGPDQTVSVGDTVTVDGSKSTDVTGNLLTYQWAIISRPSGSAASLSDPMALRPTFVVDLPGSYTVQLVVYDGATSSTPSICTITTENSPPVANAGPDQKVSQGNTVALNGSKSTDVDGNLLSYQWSILSKPAGSSATLSDPTSVRPSFVADVSGVYVAQLIVNDGVTDSLPETCVITTGNFRPVANAGPDQTISTGQTVTLDGSGSRDANGNTLAFHWSFTSVPSKSKAKLSGPTTVKPTFVADLAGTYVVQLTVNDGTMDSLPRTVVITTENSRPVAIAGPDRNADVGDTVVLDGSNSKDADNGPLNFRWDLIHKPAGSASALDSPMATNPSFVPDLPGFYVIQLMVSDGAMESYPDTVTVSAIVRMITVPNVVGLAQSAAESAITGASLRVGAITTAYSDTVQAGYVISQTPVAGTSVAKWSFVSLVVSLGPPPVTVPNVVGMGQASAESAILAAQLTVGTITSQNSDTVPAGNVISQSPQGGSSAPQGSAVDLRISLGPAIPPPDPGTVAPPIDTTVATTVGKSTEFLYTGSNPIQTGVVPGTIEPKRAAVVRGKVLDGNGLPLPAVTITILNHPEYGQTLSRLDGMFDMVVNGGGLLSVRYEKTGYLTVQRQRNIPWQDYMWLPEIRMVLADPNVTFVDLSSSADFQIIRGSVITDDRGARQSTVLIPKGTQAFMVFPDGHEESITSLTVRATEFTTGSEGEKKMPAELPPTSAYTYCEEFTVEEAVEAGAPEVRFSQMAISYNENFLNFPVGTGIPLGAYNRERGVWIPSDNGKVIKIMSITNGIADLDTDGNGTIDNGVTLGITTAERQALANLYTAGQSLWRVLVPHFTRPWDKNMGVMCQQPCDQPKMDSPFPRKPICPDGTPAIDEETGSIIGCQSQTLAEDASITGTPYYLHYQSDRARGRAEAYQISIPLTGSSISPSLRTVYLEVEVAGQKIVRTYGPAANLTDTFTWDGKDAYGREVQGRQPITVRIGYGFKLIYGTTDRFGYNGNGAQILVTNNLFVIWQAHKGWIGLWQAQGQGLGGWTLDVHHAYNPIEKVLYLGDGRQFGAESLNLLVIDRMTAPYSQGSFSDGIPASQAAVDAPSGITVGSDSSIYVGDTRDARVRRIGPDGIISTVAGNRQIGFSGDGGPATQAKLSSPQDVALGPDGSIYIADRDNNRIRRVDSNGIITTVAGSGGTTGWFSCGYSGDNGPATEARLCLPSSVAIGADGSLYIADIGNSCIRRVATEGTITTLVGVPADSQMKVASAPDGSLYILHSNTVKKMKPDGSITAVVNASNNPCTYPTSPCGDGGLATGAQLNQPCSLAVGTDGSLYIGDQDRVRLVGTDGIIRTIAGKGVGCWPLDSCGDGGPATQAEVGGQVLGVAVGPEGSVFISDGQSHRMRRIFSPLPGYSSSDIFIPGRDGTEAYVFGSNGLHLRTLNTLTGAIRHEFTYDANGLLIAVTDGDGNVTTIERDGTDRPLAIISPYGQRTTLTGDSNGYLSVVTNPASETAQFAYTGEGLMTAFTDPRGFLHTFTYDSLGLLIKDEDPAGGSQSLSRAEITNGFQVAVTTAMGRSTNYSVENLPVGNQHRVNTYPDGTQVDTLDRKDGSSTVISPDGTTLGGLLGPDPRFGMQAPILTSQTIAMPSNLTATTTMARTATLSTPDNPLTLSSLKDEITINGRKYTTNYTASTKTFTVTSPVGRQVTSKIDPQGRLVERQIAGFLPLGFTYDSQGRLASVKQGSGNDLRESTLQYDSQGFLHTVTDPLSQTLSLEYDQAGRVTTEILPDSRETTYAYDANGNMTSLTPPGKPSHTFTYTPVDLIAEYTPPDIGIGTVKSQYAYNPDRQIKQVLRPDGLSTVFGYDTGGRLKDVTYPGGPVTYTYDPAKGYLTQTDGPSGSSVSYAYDGQLVTSESWAGEVTGQVAWTYDTNFRVTSLSVNGPNTVAYQYDNDNLITKAGDLTLTRSAQNGFLTGSTLGNVTDAWTYNSFGEPASYIAKYGTNEIFNQQFTYDKLGRIAQKVETVGGITATYEYVYDPAGRLTEVKKNGSTISTYAYDSNDNRMSYSGPGGPVNGAYDNQDRLIQYGTSTYSYTANGELESKSAEGQTTLYNYDVLGNLNRVTLPDGTFIDFPVDGQDRRLGKKVNGTWVRKFLYMNQLKPVAELDAGNALISFFVYGSRFNVPEYMVKGGVTYRIVSDQLGSPRLVVDVATGTVIQAMNYDEFGNVIGDTNPGFQPFGFAGGLYDPDTSLVHFGARDYDAEVGRWTAKDPILFGGDQEDLYAYVGNDPINQTDVLGTIIFGGGGKKPEVPTPNSNIRPLRESDPKPAPEPNRPRFDMDWYRRWYEWNKKGRIGPEPTPTVNRGCGARLNPIIVFLQIMLSSSPIAKESEVLGKQINVWGMGWTEGNPIPTAISYSYWNKE